MLCDDEPLALERVGRMLAGLPKVEIAGAFLSGEELLARIDGEIDLLLLDVEMPKLDGFDVVERLSRRGETPLVIFVTAHSEFAAGAFDSGAVDFLTKPVRLNRVERALERAREALENREARRRLAEIADQLDELKRLRAGVEDEPHIWLRKGARLVRVDVTEIDWIAAEGECVRFHCGADSYLERQSITAVEQRLSPFGFVRIHRSAVVNAGRIEALSRTRWGPLQVRLRDGPELRVSKSFQPAIRKLLQDAVPTG